jgi:crotonobetainyl-CoA:carnitine CoA-transferase CaiB-like acyl-CoA transferase
MTKTRDEWTREFKGLNICVGPVNSIKEALIQPAATFREMVFNLVHLSAGKHKEIGTH